MSEKFNIKQVTSKAQEFITSKLEKPANFMNTHPNIRIGSAVAGTGVAIFATGAIGASVFYEVFPNTFKLNMNPEQICEVGKSWEVKRKDSQTKFKAIQDEKTKNTKVPEKAGFITKSKDSKPPTTEQEYSVIGTISSSKLQSIFKDGLGFNMQDQGSMLVFTNQFRQLLIEVDPEQILSNKQQQDLYSWFLRERIVGTTDMTPKRPSDGSIQDKATQKLYQAEYNKDRNLRIQLDRANKEAAKKKKPLPYPLNEVPPVYSPDFDKGKLDQIWYDENKNIVTKYISSTNENDYNTFVASLNTKIESLRTVRIEELEKDNCKNDTKVIFTEDKAKANLASVTELINQEAEGRGKFKFGKKARNVQIEIKDYPIGTNEQIGRNLINLTSLVKPNRYISEARLSRILTSVRPIIEEKPGLTITQAAKDKTIKTQQLTQELVEIRKDIELEKKTILDSDWQKMYTRLALLAGGIGVGGLSVYSMYLHKKIKNGEEGKVVASEKDEVINGLVRKNTRLKNIPVGQGASGEIHNATRGEFTHPEIMLEETFSILLSNIRDKNYELYSIGIKNEMAKHPSELGGIPYYTYEDLKYMLDQLPEFFEQFTDLNLKQRTIAQIEVIQIFIQDLQSKVDLISTSYIKHIDQLGEEETMLQFSDQKKVLNIFIPEIKSILKEFLEFYPNANDRIQLKNVRDKTLERLELLLSNIPKDKYVRTKTIETKITNEETVLVESAFDKLFKNRNLQCIKSFENWYKSQQDSYDSFEHATEIYLQTRSVNRDQVIGDGLRNLAIIKIENELLFENTNFIKKFVQLDKQRFETFEAQSKENDQIGGLKKIFKPLVPILLLKYYESINQESLQDVVTRLNLDDRFLGSSLLIDLLESGHIQNIVQSVDIQENVPISLSDVWTQSISRLPSVNETAGNIKNTLLGIKDIKPKEALRGARNKIEDGAGFVTRATSEIFEDSVENLTKIKDRGIKGNLQDVAIIWDKWSREARANLDNYPDGYEKSIADQLITTTSDIKKSSVKISQSIDKLQLDKLSWDVITYRDQILNLSSTHNSRHSIPFSFC